MKISKIAKLLDMDISALILLLNKHGYNNIKNGNSLISKKQFDELIEKKIIKNIPFSFSSRKNKKLKYGIASLWMVLVLVISFGIYLFINISEEEINYNFRIEKTQIDFILPQPSKEQVEDIINLSHIDNITPYYYFYNFAIDATSSQFYMIEDKVDVNKTYFSDELLIKNNDFTSQSLLIDEVLAKKLGKSLGDTVAISIGDSDVTFTIDGIYYGNAQRPDGFGLFFYEDAVKTAVDAYANEITYSGAFLKSNNISQTTTWLSTYVPLAELRDRSEFESDDMYQNYIDLLESVDYTNSTFKVGVYLNNQELMYQSTLNFLLLGKVLNYVISFVAITLLIIRILYRYMKKELKKDFNLGWLKIDELRMFNRFIISSFGTFNLMLIIMALITYLLYHHISINDLLLFETVVVLSHSLTIIFTYQKIKDYTTK